MYLQKATHMHSVICNGSYHHKKSKMVTFHNCYHRAIYVVDKQILWKEKEINMIKQIAKNNNNNSEKVDRLVNEIFEQENKSMKKNSFKNWRILRINRIWDMQKNTKIESINLLKNTI